MCILMRPCVKRLLGTQRGVVLCRKSSFFDILQIKQMLVHLKALLFAVMNLVSNHHQDYYLWFGRGSNLGSGAIFGVFACGCEDHAIRNLV